MTDQVIREKKNKPPEEQKSDHPGEIMPWMITIQATAAAVITQ